jgi:hypothetical protein
MIELQKKTPTCIRIEHRHRGFGEVTDPGKIAKIVKSLLNSYERKSSTSRGYQYVINVQWVVAEALRSSRSNSMSVPGMG